MSIASIVAELDAEISRLEEARAVLGQIATPKAFKRTSAPASKAPMKRKLSAAVRERIAAAQRKRWADHKAKTEPAQPARKSASAKNQAPSKMSAAGRKRIAAAQKKRWAAIKAARHAQKSSPARRAASAKKAAPKTAPAKAKKAVPEKATPVPEATATS